MDKYNLGESMARIKLDEGYTNISNPYAALYDSGEEVPGDISVENNQELPEDYGTLIDDTGETGSSYTPAFQGYTDQMFTNMMKDNPYSLENYQVPGMNFNNSISNASSVYSNPYAESYIHDAAMNLDNNNYIPPEQNNTFTNETWNNYTPPEQNNLLGPDGYSDVNLNEYTGMNWNTVYSNTDNNQTNTEVINPGNTFEVPEQNTIQ